jgi:hypothetical protein
MSLMFSQSALIAKGGRGQGDNPGRGSGHGAVAAQKSNGNGQGTVDRDFGTDRAKEVGQGKKKGLYKDQYSIGDGRDKDRSHDAHKHDAKKSRKINEDKERNKR